MTTTLTKSKSPSSEMKHFTGMESISLKMVSILLMVVLNITGLSSQTFVSYSVIKPTVSYYKNSTRSLNQKIYNLHIVREFPLIEGVSKQDLKKMDVPEGFDYKLIFGSVLTKVKITKNQKTI